MEFAIEIDSLSKYYDRSPALKNVSFNVKKGEVFGLLGQNGAGKTTLIKILLGFVRKNSGKVSIMGQEISSYSRSKIGFLPEKVTIHPFLTAIEFLKVCGRLSGLPAFEILKKSEAMLERVGLADKRNERTSSFSKGMLQRLGLAQCLLHDPEILLLDEPGSGLDPVGILELRNILVEEKNRGVTVFLNSHRLLEAERLCTTVAILKKGDLIALGSPDELAKKKNLIHLVLEKEMDSIEKYISSVGSILKKESSMYEIEPSSGVDTRQIPLKIIEMGGTIYKYEIVMENLEEVFMRLVGGGVK